MGGGVLVGSVYSWVRGCLNGWRCLDGRGVLFVFYCLSSLVNQL